MKKFSASITRSEKIQIVLFMGLVAVFVSGITIRFVRAYFSGDGWTLFDSQEQLTGVNDPDGFRMEKPASWNVIITSEGGSHNLGERRAAFRYPYYILSSPRYLSIWWRRVDGDWTRYDARDWFIEDLAFGLDSRALEQHRDLFQEIEIGEGNYPALIGNFGSRNIRRIVVFVVGDEAFTLNFNSQTNDVETEEIFNRMLDSFEVYD